MSSEPTPPSTNADIPFDRSGRWYLLNVFPPIMLPLFMAVIDQTIVSTALPAITAELGEVERVTWVVISYLIANTIAAPVYGRLGDIMGRRNLLILSISVFSLASALCGLATSIEMLSFARILQGLGGGGLIVLPQALIGEAVPARERARYQGYQASIGVVAMTCGPVVGGYMTEHFGWRSIFMVNLPIGIVAILLVLRLTSRPGTTARGLSFDWLGLTFFAFFVAPMLLAFEQLRQFDSRVLPLILGAVAVALISLWALIRFERRTEQALFPIRLLRQPAIWRCSLLAACHGAGMVSVLTFLPIYLRVVRGASATETGYLLLPFTVAIPLVSIVIGRLISKTGKTAVYPSWTMPFATLIMLALALWAPDFDTPHLAILFGLLGASLAAVMQVVVLTVQVAVGPTALGVGAAATQISRLVGASFGAAIVGTILFATLSRMDPQTAQFFATIVDQGPSAIANLAADRQAVIRSNIADAFSAAFLAITVFMAASTCLSWTLPVRKL